MLDRKVILILMVLVVVMLASDLWQVTHGERWSLALFIPPFMVICMIVSFGSNARDVLVSPAHVAVRKEWGRAIGISCATIFTVIQLLPVLPSLGIALPASDLFWRLFLAACGLPFVVIGNRTPKLPPVQWRRPGLLSLGTAEQLTLTRVAGWLIVADGVTTIASAMFLSWRMIVLLIGSVGLATLVVILVNRFGPMVTKLSQRGGR